jgi:hypothetical protein
MSRQPNASFIGKENITDNTQASGIYTLSDVAQKVALNEFPPARFTPSRSLRFDNTRQTYLQRTFTTPTNLRKWTWSGWIKLSTVGVQQPFMSRYSDGNNFYVYGITDEGRVFVYDIYNFGSYDDYGVISNARLKDTNAWYHIVISYDTTLSRALDRFRVYVNGVLIEMVNFYGEFTQNYDSYYMNVAGTHRLGYNTDSGKSFEGYMTEINYVDGQGLDASSFGELDARTNEWKPKRYTGTYGNNGFYLKFSDNASVSSLGRDFSGYSNLLSYTDQLDNAYWTKSNTTVTANSIANPLDGTVNADKLVETATTAVHSIQNASAVTKLASATYTFSVYAKAAERTSISLQLSESGGGYMGSVFDLSAGTAYVYTGIAMTPVNADWQAITPVGNGWYRCSVSVNTTSATNITAKVCLGGYEASYAGVAGSGVHLYGMQLNAGSNPAVYTSITATPISNDWVPVNISLTSGANYDSFTDVPVVGAQVTNDTGGVVRGNYCILNRLATTNYAYSNGGLNGLSRASGDASTIATFGLTSGKWYWEGVNLSNSNKGDIGVHGTVGGNIANSLFDVTTGTSLYGYALRCYDGTKQNNNVATSYYGSVTPDNAVIGVALDLDNYKIYISVNGVWISSSDPANGSNPMYTLTPGLTYFPSIGDSWGSAQSGFALNFGQKPFTYTPPRGFKSICTTNLPEPTIKQPKEHFDIKLWGGTTQALTIGNTARATDNYQISRSLRFRKDAPTYLERTPSVSGNRRTWTYSTWVKFGDIRTGNTFNFGLSPQYGGDNANECQMYLLGTADGVVIRAYDSGGSAGYFLVRTTTALRNTSDWNHIVVAVDTTHAVATNRVIIYVNGVRQPLNIELQVSQNQLTGWNHTFRHRIGVPGYSTNTNQAHDGYLAEINHVDGQQLTPDSFGEFDVDGSWKPKRYAGTYGTNGFYLNFSDNSNTTATTLGKDQVGSNNFTPVNFSVTAGSGNDSLVDVPTNWGGDTVDSGGEVRGNYCVWDPLNSANVTITNGNLFLNNFATGSTQCAVGTLKLPSGKWYFEYVVTGSSFGGHASAIGVAVNRTTSPSGTSVFSANNTVAYYGDGAAIYRYGSVQGYYLSWPVNSVLQVALDVDNQKIWFGVNGTWASSGNPSTGANPTASELGSGIYEIITGDGASVETNTTVVNFGQRPFTYTPPTGFKSLNTKNLDEKIPFTKGPDLVWIKTRNTTSNHTVADSVRGPGREIWTSLTTAEQSAYPTKFVTDFTSNGFRLGPSDAGTGDVNINSNNYVGWCWNAGSTTIGNQDGAIGSSVRVNRDAGFSIVSYTGIGSDTNVGHGLGKTPDFIIWKALDDAYNWDIYHKILGHTATLIFTASGTRNVLHQAPTDLTIPVKHDYTGGSAAGKRMIAYCWTEVPGYSRFGSYTGNGSSEGPFVYTGFRPRFILGKDSSNPAGANNWWIFDTARDVVNDNSSELQRPNLTDGDLSNANRVEILSNGFKVRASGALPNDTSGAVYVYAAFAEMPFKYALAR